MKTQHPLPPHLTPVLVSGIGAQIIYKIGGKNILQPYQNVRVYVSGFFSLWAGTKLWQKYIRMNGYLLWRNCIFHWEN